MTKAPKNIGASVRDRLLQLARQRGDDFQLLLTRYANERLLYRLARAIRATPLPASLPMALTREFADDPVKKTQWTAFARKSDADNVGDLALVVERVARFLGEPLTEMSKKSWAAGGPWR